MSNQKDDWEDEWDEFSNSSDEDDHEDDTKPDDEGEAKDDFVNDTDDEDASSNDTDDNVVDAPTNPDEEEFESNSEDESDEQSEEDEFEEEQNNEEEVELDEEYYNSDQQDDGNDGDKSDNDKDYESETSKRSRDDKDYESDRGSSISYCSDTNNIAQFFYELWHVEMNTTEDGLAQLSFNNVTIRTYKLGIDCKGLQLQFDVGKNAAVEKTIDEEMFKVEVTYPDSDVSRWVEITFNPLANLKTSQIVLEFDEKTGHLFIILPDNRLWMHVDKNDN